MPTPRLGIPTMAATPQSGAQAVYNDSMFKFGDVLMPNLILAGQSANAPGSPTINYGYRVLATPTPGDDFENHIDDIGFEINGAWEFVTPQEGWFALLRSTSPPQMLYFNGTAWDAPDSVAKFVAPAGGSAEEKCNQIIDAVANYGFIVPT